MWKTFIKCNIIKTKVSTFIEFGGKLIV